MTDTWHLYQTQLSRLFGAAPIVSVGRPATRTAFASRWPLVIAPDNGGYAAGYIVRLPGIRRGLSQLEESATRHFHNARRPQAIT
jgi:hypothetical protein